MLRLVVFLLLFALGAEAQNTSPGPPASINVSVYGAKCDGVTDDAAAINLALAAVRATSVSYGNFTGPHVYMAFPAIAAATCLIRSPLNFTNLQGFSLSVQGNGVTIHCSATGGVCFDGLGSRWVDWEGVTIIGDCTNVPKIGLQIGRTNTTALSDADRHRFRNVIISGCFTQSNLYNMASETSEFDGVSLYQYQTSATAYALIQDGYNHWNAQSTFVTESAPVDSPQSFDENTFISLDVRNSGGGPTMWIGNTNRHRFIGSYSATVGGAYGAVLYTENTGQNNLLNFDMHFEANSLADVFFLSGPNNTPILDGFAYKDQGPTATDAIFLTDTNITSAIMRQTRLEIAGYISNSVNLFHTASLWTVTGDYFSQLIAGFNMPASWQGRIAIGQQETQAIYGPNAFFALNMPDGTTLGGNARGAGSVDLQSQRDNALFVASGDYSTVAGKDNEAQGAGAVAMGLTNVADNTGATAFGTQNVVSAPYSSTPGGKGATDRGRTGILCYSSTYIAVAGDNQWCANELQGTATSTTPVVLTVDGAAQTALTSIYIPADTAYHLKISLHARDVTNPGKDYDYYLPNGFMTQDATASTTQVTLGTPVVLSRGTVTGAAVSVTANTSCGCLNVSFTPPSGNADTWHIGANVQTSAEVQ